MLEPLSSHPTFADNVRRALKTGEFVVSLNPPSIGAGALGVVTGAIAGAKTTDKVLFIAPTALEAGLVPMSARISATDIVEMTLFNPTAAPVDGAALSWTFILLRA
jgi:hypothetical protein